MTSFELFDFLARFDEWAERDQPGDDRKLVVMDWIHSLQANPYLGATRRTDLGANVWFAEIPDSADETHTVVSTYVVDPDRRQATCWNIATLRLPIVP